MTPCIEQLESAFWDQMGRRNRRASYNSFFRNKKNSFFVRSYLPLLRKLPCAAQLLLPALVIISVISAFRITRNSTYLELFGEFYDLELMRGYCILLGGK